MVSVRVQENDFDPGLENDALYAGRVDVGAVVSFTGLVRSDGDVLALNLEHYPAMTEKALAAIVAQASARWPVLGARVVHRVGRLLPGERIVYVGVASSHRAAAFAACEFLMDYLKTRAPFWKKEETVSGVRWVEARDEDEQAAARWQV